MEDQVWRIRHGRLGMEDQLWRIRYGGLGWRIEMED